MDPRLEMAGEAETGQSMVEEEPIELLDKDKSPMATNRASNETDKAYKGEKGTLKDVRKDGGMTNTWVKGKGEEEPSHGSQRQIMGFF